MFHPKVIYFVLDFLLYCLYTVFMSRLINFRSTESDDQVIADLQKKTGLTVTALIRQALRLLHKKEVKS